MRIVKKIIRAAITVILAIIAVIDIAFMIWAAFEIYNRETLHFDRWEISEAEAPYTDENMREQNRKIKEEGNYSVECFSFSGGAYYHDQALCYAEIQNPCFNYACQMLEKYKSKANLKVDINYTPKILTVTFTGWGYPDEGEPECLDRTYIFDIEGVGKDKLPVLLNKDEIY